MRKEWIAPLTGVAFIVVVAIGIIVGGQPPEAKDASAQEIVQHYVDHKDSTVIAALLLNLAAVFLVFFGGYLRTVLKAGEGPVGYLSAIAFAGFVIVAIAAAIDATISIALAETADDIDPTGVQTLQALWDNDFVPLILGVDLILFASGLSLIRYRQLPVWLGWAAVVLAILGVTPLGFIAFFGSGVWVLVMSIVMTMRVRAEPTRAATV